MITINNVTVSNTGLGNDRMSLDEMFVDVYHVEFTYNGREGKATVEKGSVHFRFVTPPKSEWWAAWDAFDKSQVEEESDDDSLFNDPFFAL